MQEETTQVRELRTLNELVRKHAGHGITGLTAGSIPTVAALIVGWQTITTKGDNVAEINNNLKDLTTQVESNATAITQLRADLAQSDNSTAELKALVIEVAASQREIRRDLYYLTRMIGGDPPPKD